MGDLEKRHRALIDAAPDDETRDDLGAMLAEIRAHAAERAAEAEHGARIRARAASAEHALSNYVHFAYRDPDRYAHYRDAGLAVLGYAAQAGTRADAVAERTKAFERDVTLRGLDGIVRRDPERGSLGTPPPCPPEPRLC